MSIDKETIQKARQTNLPNFLIVKGEPLRKSGRRWQHKFHDSLIISDNMFFWNSRQLKGNAISFVMAFYGWSFEKAVQELIEFNKVKTEPKKEEEPAELHIRKLHISQAPDNKRVIAYLCRTRKISYNLVKKLIASQHITQDEKGNVVFKIHNELGELVGAEICGTLSEVRYKSIAEGTELGYGFNVSIGEPEKTLFFESPIDLLSFWTLNESKLTAHRLVSLAGLRQDILENTLRKFQITPETIYLCVDNDPAGKDFIKAVRSKHSTVKIYIPKILKDWNDTLRSM